MTSIQVLEAFSLLRDKAFDEKRIITKQEYDDFARKHHIRRDKNEFLKEWWDFRFMKVQRLIDSNTSEADYQRLLKEYRQRWKSKSLSKGSNPFKSDNFRTEKSPTIDN